MRRIGWAYSYSRESGWAAGRAAVPGADSIPFLEPGARVGESMADAGLEPDQNLGAVGSSRGGIIDRGRGGRRDGARSSD